MERYDTYSTLADDLALSEQANWLSQLLGAVSGLGGLLGGGAKASADSRRDDALIQNQLASQNNRAMVDAAGHNLQAPSTLGRRSLGASSLLNYKPMQISDARMPKVSGGGGAGFAQGLQDPALRQQLQSMLTNSARSQQTGDYMVKPQQAEMKKAGWLEKIGGIAGTLGGLAGGLGMMGVGQGGNGYTDPVVSTAGMPQLPGGGLPGKAMGGEQDPTLAWLLSRNSPGTSVARG